MTRSKSFEECLERLESGCWGWTAKKNRAGYGIYRGKPAHRVSYELHREPIPAGLYVCHKCDNPPCVNPEHLFLGTARDNAYDMIAKGRNSPPPRFDQGQRRGTGNPRARLTPEQVLLIREDKRTRHAIAADYGVSAVTIFDIRTRRTWSHV